MPTISIIIPCYNEAQTILQTVQSVQTIFVNNTETIIIDQSDNNETYNTIKSIPNIIYEKSTGYGRSDNMNQGAKIAKGKILLFLHADTELPKQAYQELSILDLKQYCYGGFYKKFIPNNLRLNLISIHNNIRSDITGYLLGDNAIFIEKDIFQQIGGFPNQKLFEDVEISKTLKKISKQNNKKIKIIKYPLFTSSRKFIQKGTIKTRAFMQYMRFLYRKGTSVDKLEEVYKNRK